MWRYRSTADDPTDPTDPPTPLLLMAGAEWAMSDDEGLPSSKGR